MLLSDRDIRKEIRTGELSIKPYVDELVQPSSVDIRLSNQFRLFNQSNYTHIDPQTHQPDLTKLHQIGYTEWMVLHPGEFILGSTLESFKFGNTIAARVEGKSSLGRLGLLTHSTAGFIDPGFEGNITFELSNVSKLPILLQPGMKIGQLCVFKLSSPAERPYGSPGLGSHYQGQRGPTEGQPVK